MALGQEPRNGQVLPPFAAYFSLGSLLVSIHSYGFSVGEIPPHTNFNKPGHPQG
jgi:hypothetical protein